MTWYASPMAKSMNVISLLSELVAIDSQSSKDNSPIISLVQKWFEKYPQTIQTWVREIDGVKGKNLIIKIAGKRSDQATVFICHLDTVPPNDSWETDPFILEEQEGNLYGLGACDTKGGVAALLQAVLTLTEKPARDTYILFDGDEEETSEGVNKFVKKCAIKNPQFIAIEPTDTQVLIAQRAIVKMKITTHGTSQHSSKATPEINEKYNAIHKMAKVMIALEKDAEKIAKEKDDFMGTNTQNFGIISGGTAHNVVPQSCSLTMHRRLLPQRDATKELQEVRKIVKEADSGASVELIGPPELGFKTSHDSSFAKQTLSIVKKTLPQMKFGVFIAWSEAGATNKKGESLILGPGSIQQAHRANEYINAQELFHFVEIFSNLLQEVVV